jgi:UDP-N-acetylglucosamine 2-epimerase (non-hydrolysing)
MRYKTERPEGIAAGTLKPVDTGEEVISKTFKQLLENKLEHGEMSKAINPYEYDLQVRGCFQTHCS